MRDISLIWHIRMNNGTLEVKSMNKPKIALTIAGTDPSGGAGVMADLKIISFLWCLWYGCHYKHRCSKYERCSTHS